MPVKRPETNMELKQKVVPKSERPYSVVPYDPKWKEIYKREEQVLGSIFKGVAQTIEHVGSTSVEGMWAKPQIDITVVVNDFDEVTPLISQLASRGYQYQPSFDIHNKRYFTRDAASGERLISVHVMENGDPQITSKRYLRDYLSTHPEERELYSQVKRQAYETGANREEYPELKRTVLEPLLQRAHQWHESKK